MTRFRKSLLSRRLHEEVPEAYNIRQTARRRPEHYRQQHRLKEEP